MKRCNQKRAFAMLMAFAFAVLCLPGSALTTKAEGQVEVRIAYHYVNAAGENSRYEVVESVPGDTTWGEFIESHLEICEQIPDANAENQWDNNISVTNLGYVPSRHATQTIEALSKNGATYMTFRGMPSDYKWVSANVGCYEDGELKDGGHGYGWFMPEAYAYGSEEALSFIERNIGVFNDYLAPFLNREGAVVSVEPYAPANGMTREGYIVRIYVTSSSEGSDVEEEMDVITSSGTVLGSTVSVSNVTANAVVITTPYQNVASAAGLTGEQAVTASVTGYLGPEAQKTLDNAVMAAGANLAYAVEVALNTSDGISVHELSSPITLVMDLPGNLDGNVYDFAVIHIHGDGTVTLLPDLDDDPKTITVSSDRFSVYAVIYGAKGSFSAARGVSSAVRDSVPKTGHVFPKAVPISAAASLAAVAVMVLSLSKRKRA